jgi:S-DNA-T family DNA segregation ATPase FtsK/SpoIIIE
VLGQLLAGSCLRHLYLLDGDGTLAALQDHPRVGAYVGVHELRRGARVVARLSEECALRLARGPGAPRPVPLLLVVSGWGSWVSALRQSPQAWAEEGLGDLVRDGAGAGLYLVACGERELVASRTFGGLPARLFFPLGTTDEARLSWPRLPQMPHLRGRAAAVGTIAPAGPLAAQCCLQAASEGPFPEHRERGGPQRRRPTEPAPFRIDPLPASAPAGLVAELADTGHGLPLPRGRLRLLVGLAGDEGRPLALGVGAGEVLLALGTPGSGKSTLLAALPAMNPGVDFLAPAPASRAAEWEAELERRTSADSAAERTAHTVLLIDDADRLDPAQNQLLAQLLEAGASVVATAGYSPSLFARCPLALAARSAGTGLLLAPRSANDGDVFGIRVDVPGRVPPGRAVAVVEGQQIDVQLGWDGPGADTSARRPLRRSQAPRHPGHPDRRGARGPG